MERLASSYYGKMIVNPAKTLKQYRINVKKKAATIMSKPYNVNETVTFEEFLKVLFLRKNPDGKMIPICDEYRPVMTIISFFSKSIFETLGTVLQNLLALQLNI